ncbi:MAG: N-acetylmuramoyl-L-alanine amidase [Rickettsiales bacterium]|jgi:N-acetylmuramoyl-L-alanine amidase|nr:N-acetylmuramoyl-L-alanine amidase [Rickettsiales bacterium]
MIRGNRRTFLKIAGVGFLAITFLPRVAFAARNTLRDLRTGVQPGGKTRLVIELENRPNYTLEFLTNPDRIAINLSNTAGDTGLRAGLASGTLVKNLRQNQLGDKLQIVADLQRPVGDIPKNQIMILEPKGDTGYRLVLDFVAGSAATNTAAGAGATATKKTRTPVIVIDAGHGGRDPGCIGRNGTKEKTIVLAMAKKLRDELKSKGFRVYLTRDSDIFLNLDTRAGIAEKNHADLFVSLHANANPSRSMRGFSIYTLSKTASDEESKKLAEAENAADKIEVDGFERFEPNIRNALSALQQHAVSELSVEFADDVSKKIKSSGVEIQPGPRLRQAAFAVLRSTIPGALIEVGHLSNTAEEKLLKTGSHQNKLVSAIARAIMNYDFDV